MQEITNERVDLHKLSVRDLFYKYIRFLPLYVLCLSLALLGAWLYLRYAQEKYESIGSMIVETNEGSGRGDKVEDLISGKNRDRNIQSEIEVLRSKALLTRVVRNANLQYSYTAKGKIKDADAYKTTPFLIQQIQLSDSSQSFSIPIEFINRSQFRVGNGNTNYNFGQVFKTQRGLFKLLRDGEPTSGSEYVIHYAPAEAVAATMASGINVQPKMGTTILSIQYETTNPYLAADVINGLMQEYNTMSIEQSNQSMDQTIGFVDRRLAVLERDIDSIQKKLLAYQRSNEIVNVETQIEDLLKKSNEQDALVMDRRMALSSLNQIENYLKNSSTQYNRVPSSLGIEDPTLNQLIQRYNEAQLERKNEIEANASPENPKIKQLNDNIDFLRRSTLENVRMLQFNYRNALSVASSEKSRSKGAALQMPAKVNEQVELERQLVSKLTLFKLLDEKKEEVAITRSSTQPTSRIVEVAEARTNPVKPQKSVIQLAAFVLGLALPTAFIFLREMLNDRINTRGDIEKITEAPILGEVGHSYSESTLVVNKTSRSLIAEQFRILRSNLQYIIGKRSNAIIIVTSSFGGEGKSFISTNMGAVFALTDKKTVVLEFDLRKPKVLAGLNMTRLPGISNYIVGNNNLDELIVPVNGHTNLFVLPCGPVPPNPSEMLLNTKIQDLFTELQQKFDYIIIDTAPVGMVSDALTLGKFADCTMYVTRQGHTFKKQVALIDEMYKTKKLPHLTVILNDVKMPTGGGYYGNYGYGYYGYGEKKNDYYEEETRPKRKFAEKAIDALNPLTWFGPKN